MLDTELIYTIFFFFCNKFFHVKADKLIICITAMFLGKNIFLASDSSTKEHPWIPIILDNYFEGLPPITLACLNKSSFVPLVRKPRENNDCMGCGWRGTSMGDHFLQSTKYCGSFQDQQTLSHTTNFAKSLWARFLVVRSRAWLMKGLFSLGGHLLPVCQLGALQFVTFYASKMLIRFIN